MFQQNSPAGANSAPKSVVLPVLASETKVQTCAAGKQFQPTQPSFGLLCSRVSACEASRRSRLSGVGVTICILFYRCWPRPRPGRQILLSCRLCGHRAFVATPHAKSAAQCVKPALGLSKRAAGKQFQPTQPSFGLLCSRVRACDRRARLSAIGVTLCILFHRCWPRPRPGRQILLSCRLCGHRAFVATPHAKSAAQCVKLLPLASCPKRRQLEQAFNFPPDECFSTADCTMPHDQPIAM